VNRRQELRRAVLLTGLDDWVGLWEIVRLVRERESGDINDLDVKSLVIGLLTQLLDNDEVQVGSLINGGEFSSWPSSKEEAMRDIITAWENLGRDPNIGEVCWLQNTELGDRLAREWSATSSSPSLGDDKRSS
jgi:hypothetical protein